MKRTVVPELLDELPSEDPTAIRSREDLCRVNVLMRHHRLIQRALLDGAQPKPPARIVDLGAGDGRFSLGLARRLRRTWDNLAFVLVDRLDTIAPATLDGFRQLGCRCERHRADVFEWLEQAGRSSDDCMIANLFLHHFDNSRLRSLLAGIADHCSMLIACEPRRSRFVHGICHFLGVLGCNHVTRHDAVVSVRAGFRGAEISALWPDVRDWAICEGPAGMFSHLYVARRTRIDPS